MRTALWLLLVFATPAFAGQTVWKWVDGDGVTHYADRPVPGATRIELNLGARDRSGEAATNSASPATPATAPTEPRAANEGPTYTDFEIVEPRNAETIPNTGGEVSIELRIRPGLQPGHSVHLYLDGRRVEGFPGNTTNFLLQEVPRGEHSAVAVVVDAGGRRIQETAPVRFFVRQTSIAQPPVGPALRTPPKPSSPGSANKLPTRQPSHADLHGARPPIDARTNAPPPPKAPPKPKTP